MRFASRVVIDIFTTLSRDSRQRHSFSRKNRKFLIDRINFAARDKIDSPLSNRLTSIFNLERIKKKKRRLLLGVFRVFFLSRGAACE